METKVVGRKEELATLGNFLESDRAEFLAIYGRRRVGKTFLIRMFFREIKNTVFFNVTGSKGGKMYEQIAHFTQRLGETFYSGADLKQGKTWDETFQMLQDAILQVSKEKKVVIFLDELPWMASRNSRVLESLDYYWNQYWSFDQRVKLIVCGSSASWIIKNIINNKGGLHNRITRKIQLKPFKLTDTKAYLQSNGVKLNNEQVTQLYMATGGIPYYLAGVNKGESATQAIENLAFKHDSILLKEFDNLFASLFENPEPYEEILRILSNHRYGLSQEEIATKFEKLQKGGGVSKRLKDLKDAGFVLGFKPYKHKKKGTYYRIIDEYTLFYFHWIEPIKDTLQEESLERGYWQNTQSTPAWHSWAGYAFEAICYKHLSEIRRKLNIPPTAIAASWRYVPNKKSSDNGAQIDLMFDRLDNAITICEIKYSNKPFVINKQYARELVNKGKVFADKTRVRKQQFIALIASSGLKDNLYADDIISGEVELKDLFE